MVSKSEEQQAQILEQQSQIASLIDSLKQMPGVQEPVRITVNQTPIDAAVIRADKVQKLAFNMRKSGRVKPFKINSDSDVKLFLKKFEEELVSIKNMVGIEDDLTRKEYVPIFRSCLDFSSY